MNITRKSAIRTLTAVVTAGVIAAGTGAAIAANNTSNNSWRGMMGGSRTGTSMMGAYGTANGYGLGMMRGANDNQMMKPVADYLGLSTTDLVAQLRAGSSLAGVADSQGKTTSGLKNVMLRAMQEYLGTTSITSSQKSSMLSHMRASIDAMLNANHTSNSGTGFRGMMGGNWMNSN